MCEVPLDEIQENVVKVSYANINKSADCFLKKSNTFNKSSFSFNLSPTKIPDASPEDDLDHAINLEEMKSKMVSLKEMNNKIRQKIIGELDLTITNQFFWKLDKKIDYLNLSQEEGNKFDPMIAYMLFVSGTYNKLIKKPKIFDQFSYDKFLTSIANHKTSQDQMEILNTMLKKSIANAKKNQALIENSLKDPDLDKIAQEVEMKRMQLESEMKELTESITELELKPRDEEAIEKIKSTNVMEIIKISGELNDKIPAELNTNKAFLEINDAINDMVDTQKDLISSLILV